MKDFRLIRKLNWEEVFLWWYQNEGKSENWINLAKKRGYASWAEWRIEGYIRSFECQKAEWELYEISDPTRAILGFYGGPFRTWIERYYNNKKTKNFFELAKNEILSKNDTIRSIMSNYPVESIIVCLDVDEKMFVIEGMHRACALAIMHNEVMKKPDKLFFAIGKSKLKELPAVGENSSD
jgi:hypothetical protein